MFLCCRGHVTGSTTKSNQTRTTTDDVIVVKDIVDNVLDIRKEGKENEEKVGEHVFEAIFPGWKPIT